VQPPVPIQDEREPTLFAVPLMQFLVGILLFVSLLYVRTDLIILSVLILGVMGLSNLLSRFSLGGVSSITSLDKERLFPGEKLTLTIAMENTRILPVWIQIAFPLTSPTLRRSPESEPKKECGLLFRQRIRFTWQMVPLTRGVYRVGSPPMRVADPLGFFPRDKETTRDLELIVYPRLVSLKVLPIQSREFFGFPGAASPVKDPVYMLGTRDYQQNQPARHIHWKASARHNRLQEKVFEPSEQRKVLLLLEVSQFRLENAADPFERTLEAVASLARELDQGGCALGLATNGMVGGAKIPILPIERNPHQMSLLLELLARLEMKSKEDLITIIRRGMTLPRGLSCVHFSRMGDDFPLPILEYFLFRKIPLLRVISGKTSGKRKENAAAPQVFRLEDLTAQEEEPSG
jgi:uncharacterized protein (DUF58 family)